MRRELEAFAACDGRERNGLLFSFGLWVCEGEGEGEGEGVFLINNSIRLETGERVAGC